MEPIYLEVTFSRNGAHGSDFQIYVELNDGDQGFVRRGDFIELTIRSLIGEFGLFKA
jgi:hypothetical protein